MREKDHAFTLLRDLAGAASTRPVVEATLALTARRKHAGV
jgi:hypothetical protein